MLLLCPWRVHNRGADAIGRYDVLFNREADVIGRYYILVETVLLILVEDFTSILLFVGFFPSRSYCLALDWEINAGMEIERFGIGVAVLPWRFCMTEFGTAVVPCLAMICDEICFFPFYLAIYRVFSMEFGMSRFTLHL